MLGAQRWAAEVGVFHHPGRVKFENKLWAEELGRLIQQLLWRGGSVAFGMFWSSETALASPAHVLGNSY